MKNQYFGDEGDFVKYALLRALSAEGLSLGIAWMKTPPSNNDGGDIGYLTKPNDWRKLDQDLFDFLNEKVQAGQRDTGALEASGLLSKDIVFVGDTFTGTDRDSYFQTVAKVMVGKDIVFFDPDNGIGTKGTSPSSEKHILTSDLRAISNSKQSFVVFQHYPRGLAKLDRCDFATKKAHALFGCLPAKTVYSIKGKKTVLLIAVMEPQEAQVVAALRPFLDRWWDKLRICGHNLQ